MPGRGEVVFSQRLLHQVGEALQVTTVVRAAELDDLLAAGRGQRLGGGPVFQQPQHPGGAEVLPGDGEGGREGSQQVGAQPVEQPPLVPAGPLVVAGDGPQLTGDPGGETATEAGKAQVDLAARKRLPRLVVLRAGGGAEQ